MSEQGYSMGAKKFITNIKSFLKLKDFKKEDKKRSIENLLKKLNKRKISVIKSLKVSSREKEKKELQEDLEIISLHIKKGQKLLDNLSTKK